MKEEIVGKVTNQWGWAEVSVQHYDEEGHQPFLIIIGNGGQDENQEIIVPVEQALRFAYLVRQAAENLVRSDLETEPDWDEAAKDPDEGWV